MLALQCRHDAYDCDDARPSARPELSPGGGRRRRLADAGPSRRRSDHQTAAPDRAVALRVTCRASGVRWLLDAPRRPERRARSEPHSWAGSGPADRHLDPQGREHGDHDLLCGAVVAHPPPRPGVFFLMLREPPEATLFPYTTLFR